MKYQMTKEESLLKGIYQITNLINGDFYIGSTKRNFHARYASYKSSYKRHLEDNLKAFHPYLFNAFKKYGYENFEFKILESLFGDVYEIRVKEEEYIKVFQPVYNICQYPSKGGSPNLGRKLSEEWKKKISEKSKLYKHSDNKETIEKVTLKNKNTSSVYRVWNKNTEFVGSLIDCAMFTNRNFTQLLRWVDGVCKSKEGWKIKKLRSQKKKINVFLDNENKTFESFGECDRYFDMWRGYTSTKTLQKELLMDKYEYEIIEDIV